MHMFIDPVILERNYTVLESFPGDDLNAWYLAAHHASQFVAAFGKSYLPERKDDSHTNLGYLYSEKMLAGNWINSSTTFRMGLLIDELKLVIREYNGERQFSLKLDGLVVSEIEQWVRLQSGNLGLDASTFSLKMHYVIPEHPVVKGHKFEMIDGASGILSGLFSNTYLLLAQLKAAFPGASDIRLWPHHFDLAVLIPLETDSEGNLTRSIGVGLAAPDSYYNEPYYYINHWPALEKEVTELSELKGGGVWNTKDWIGAVLPANQLRNLDKKQQLGSIVEFMNSGLAALIFS